MEIENRNCYYFTHLAVSFTKSKCFDEQVCSIIHAVVEWEKSRKRTVKSFAQSHPEHELFKSQAIPGKTASHLPYALFSKRVTVVLYVKSDVKHTAFFFFFFLQCWNMKMWRAVNETWAWHVFPKAVSVIRQLKMKPHKQMFPLRDNNGAICYTDKMCSILMLKFNQLHLYSRSVCFPDCDLWAPLGPWSISKYSMKGYHKVCLR